METRETKQNKKYKKTFKIRPNRPRSTKTSRASRLVNSRSFPMCYISLGEEGNRAAAAAAYLFFLLFYTLAPSASQMVDGAVRPTYYQRPPSVVSVCLRRSNPLLGRETKKKKKSIIWFLASEPAFSIQQSKHFPPNCLDLPPKDILRAWLSPCSQKKKGLPFILPFYWWCNGPMQLLHR